MLTFYIFYNSCIVKKKYFTPVFTKIFWISILGLKVKMLIIGLIFTNNFLILILALNKFNFLPFNDFDNHDLMILNLKNNLDNLILNANKNRMHFQMHDTDV